MALLACCVCSAEPPLYLKSRAYSTAAQDSQSRVTAPRIRNHDRAHLLVQFREAPRQGVLEEMARRGVRVVSYVPDAGFIVSAASAGALDGLDLARVEWLRPEDKLSPQLALTQLLVADETMEPPEFVVEFHPDVDPQEARSLLRDNRLSVREHPDLLPNHLLVEGTWKDAVRLAQWDEVAYIFPASHELKDGERVYACAGASTQYGRTGQYTAVYGEGWDGPGLGSAQLGYYFGTLASLLDRGQVENEILRAFAEWSRYAAVTFTPAAAANIAQTISLLFARGAHGDPYPFDGPGKVLAHTFYPAPPNPEPIAGDMHFDDDENWAIGGDIDVFSVALHEAGHALGLGHSDQPGSVMYPYYKRVTGLTQDDITAILTLYAPPGSTSPPEDPPSQPPDNPTEPTNPDTPATPVAPTLTITSPSGDVQVISPSINLAGTASHASGIARVDWANSRGGSGTASGTQTWVAGPVELQTGQNVITVTAISEAATTASRSVTVTYVSSVDAVAPSITILSPASTSVGTKESHATISGTARDNVGVVQVTWSDSIGNGGIAQGTAYWKTEPIPLRIGTNTIIIRARDAAGNTGWRSVVFTRR